MCAIYPSDTNKKNVEGQGKFNQVFITAESAENAEGNCALNIYLCIFYLFIVRFF